MQSNGEGWLRRKVTSPRVDRVLNNAHLILSATMLATTLWVQHADSKATVAVNDAQSAWRWETTSLTLASLREADSDFNRRLTAAETQLAGFGQWKTDAERRMARADVVLDDLRRAIDRERRP